MILQVSPDSSVLVRAGAALILTLHIAGGSLGIVSGFAALFLRKGSRRHRVAGMVFVASMLTMASIGATVAPLLLDRVSTVAGILTFYLVATAWTTVRRTTPGVGAFDMIMPLIPIGVVVAGLTFMWIAAHSPSGRVDGQPNAALFIFVVIGAIAAAGDVHVLLRRGLTGAQRMARHLWRMCFSLFVASGSLFLGQQRIMPQALRGSPLMFVPEIVVLGLLLFWLIRVRFPPWRAKSRRRRHAQAALHTDNPLRLRPTPGDALINS